MGGLDAELEWSHVLSLGEQQRLAFLRLLLHEPSMAFLDEATGALDNATEASCYKALQKHSTSFISVGELHMLCVPDIRLLVLLGMRTAGGCIVVYACSWVYASAFCSWASENISTELPALWLRLALVVTTQTCFHTLCTCKTWFT